jgi:WD repeat-containing protein 23
LSLCTFLHILFLFIMQQVHEGLEFSNDDDGFSFAIFSVKFSKDGRELVVGNNNESICIYDIGSNKVTERIHAHSV